MFFQPIFLLLASASAVPLYFNNGTAFTNGTNSTTVPGTTLPAAPATPIPESGSGSPVAAGVPLHFTNGTGAGSIPAGSPVPGVAGNAPAPPAAATLAAASATAAPAGVPVNASTPAAPAAPANASIPSVPANSSVPAAPVNITARAVSPQTIRIAVSSDAVDVGGYGIYNIHEGAGINYIFLTDQVSTPLSYDAEDGTITQPLDDHTQSMVIDSGIVQMSVVEPTTKFSVDAGQFLAGGSSQGFYACKNTGDPYGYSKSSWQLLYGSPSYSPCHPITLTAVVN